MGTTTRTTNIYQRLDLLYLSLTSVLPGVISPIASCYMLKALMAETSYIYNEICSLREKWNDLLPFDEDDSQQILWKHWSKSLNPDNIKRHLNTYLPYQFEYVNVPPEYEELLKNRAQMQEELLETLDKLSKVLRLVSYIVRGTLPKSIIKLYDELQKRCEHEFMDGFYDLSTIPTYALEDYKKQLHKYTLMNFIKFKNDVPPAHHMDMAEQKWKELTDENGMPNKLSVGRYIYEHRFFLSILDLKDYFEYVKLLEFMQKSDPSNGSEAPTIHHDIDCSNNNMAQQPSSPTSYIWEPGIDTENMKRIIRARFIPLLKPKNRWLCVWRALKDTHKLKEETSLEQFIVEMLAWFPNNFTKESLHVYGTTYLARIPRKEWKKEKYIEDIRSHPKASPRAFDNFNTFCAELEDIIKEL